MHTHTRTSNDILYTRKFFLFNDLWIIVTLFLHVILRTLITHAQNTHKTHIRTYTVTSSIDNSSLRDFNLSPVCANFRSTSLRKPLKIWKQRTCSLILWKKREKEKRFRDRNISVRILIIHYIRFYVCRMWTVQVSWKLDR